MKKTILALTVCSVFSMGAMAATDVIHEMGGVTYKENTKTWVVTKEVNDNAEKAATTYGKMVDDIKSAKTPSNAWKVSKDATYGEIAAAYAKVQTKEYHKTADVLTAKKEASVFASKIVTTTKASVEVNQHFIKVNEKAVVKAESEVVKAKNAFDALPTEAAQKTLLEKIEGLNAAKDALKDSKDNLAKSQKALIDAQDAFGKAENAKKTAQEKFDKEEAKLKSTKEYKAKNAADAVFAKAKEGYQSAVKAQAIATQAASNNNAIDSFAKANAEGKSISVEAQANNQAINKVADYAVENRGLIGENTKAIGENKTEIGKNRTAIANNTTRIEGLEKNFEALSKDYYSFKEQTNGAIAGVAAMGQLAQPYGVGKINLGVGVGSYNSEQAIAVGMGYRYSETTTMRAAVAANSGNDMEPIVAASVNWEW